MKPDKLVMVAALVFTGFTIGVCLTQWSTKRNQNEGITVTERVYTVPAEELEAAQQRDFENERVEQYDTGKDHQPLLTPNPNATTKPVVTMHVFKDESIPCPACDEWKAKEQKKVEEFAEVEVVADIVDRAAPYFEYCGEEREEYQTAEEIKVWIEGVENGEEIKEPREVFLRIEPVYIVEDGNVKPVYGDASLFLPKSTLVFKTKTEALNAAKY